MCHQSIFLLNLILLNTNKHVCDKQNNVVTNRCVFTSGLYGNCWCCLLSIAASPSFTASESTNVALLHNYIMLFSVFDGPGLSQVAKETLWEITGMLDFTGSVPSWYTVKRCQRTEGTELFYNIIFYRYTVIASSHLYKHITSTTNKQPNVYTDSNQTD